MWGRGSRFPSGPTESDMPGPGQYDIHRNLILGGNPGVGLHGSAPRFPQARSSSRGACLRVCVHACVCTLMYSCILIRHAVHMIQTVTSPKA